MITGGKISNPYLQLSRPHTSNDYSPSRSPYDDFENSRRGSDHHMSRRMNISQDELRGQMKNRSRTLSRIESIDINSSSTPYVIRYSKAKTKTDWGFEKDKKKYANKVSRNYVTESDSGSSTNSFTRNGSRYEEAIHSRSNKYNGNTYQAKGELSYYSEIEKKILKERNKRNKPSSTSPQYFILFGAEHFNQYINERNKIVALRITNEGLEYVDDLEKLELNDPLRVTNSRGYCYHKESKTLWSLSGTNSGLKDTFRMTWNKSGSEMTSSALNTWRRSNASLCVGDILFTVGGLGANNVPLSSVEMAKVHESRRNNPKWFEIEPLPQACYGNSLVSIDSMRIHSIGGMDYNEIASNLVYEFDIIRQSWIPCSSMNQPRAYFQSCHYESKIYVCGGVSKKINKVTDSLEVYHPYSNVWDLLSPMPIPIANGIMMGANGRLFVFQGMTLDKSDSLDVCMYKIKEDEWSTLNLGLPLKKILYLAFFEP